MKLFKIGLLTLLSCLSGGLKAQGCGKLLKQEQNKITVGCDSGEAISLKFLDARNIRFWYAPDGDFKRNNESFAVIKEEFEAGFEVNVEESNAAFEIFTEDLRVVIQKDPLRIQVYDKYQRLIMGDTDQDAYSSEENSVTTRKVLQRDEQIFGLGEKTGPLNRRGHSYLMWNSDKPCYSDTEDPLYKSIPFFMSSNNYGIG